MRGAETPLPRRLGRRHRHARYAWGKWSLVAARWRRTRRPRAMSRDPAPALLPVPQARQHRPPGEAARRIHLRRHLHPQPLRLLRRPHPAVAWTTRCFGALSRGSRRWPQPCLRPRRAARRCSASLVTSRSPRPPARTSSASRRPPRSGRTAASSSWPSRRPWSAWRSSWRIGRPGRLTLRLLVALLLQQGGLKRLQPPHRLPLAESQSRMVTRQRVQHVGRKPRRPPISSSCTKPEVMRPCKATRRPPRRRRTRRRPRRRR
mmetsp:Transcript_134833/g.341061  ORF Transcript_134833/g.341061 Transcript_134833/m.341061 type:complete len:262 (+) Transcript_134833:1296-2081(+)